MRRVWATLLLAVFSVPMGSLIAPALFASDAQSKLPSCCRRDGKHGCGMASMQARDDESGTVLGAARCSQYPGAKAAPGQLTAGVSRAVQTFSAAIVSQPAAVEQAEVLFQISYSRAGQKRGPPSLLPLA